MTQIRVDQLAIIGSDNGLSPGRRQPIIWRNVHILSIGPLQTNVIEILVGVHKFSFKKFYLKMSSAKWRPLFLGFHVLRNSSCIMLHHWHFCELYVMDYITINNCFNLNPQINLCWFVYANFFTNRHASSDRFIWDTHHSKHVSVKGIEYNHTAAIKCLSFLWHLMKYQLTLFGNTTSLFLTYIFIWFEYQYFISVPYLHHGTSYSFAFLFKLTCWHFTEYSIDVIYRWKG